MRKTHTVATFLAGLVLVVLFAPQGIAHAQSANLISNPSVETANPANVNQPLDWSTDKWGTSVATFTYPTTGHAGRSVKVQVTKTGTGDAKWYPKNIPAAPGQVFAFSNWYQSSVKSFVTVEFTLANGTRSYLELGQPAIAANWTQFSKSFTVPANVVSLTVFHYIKALGTLSADDYSLTSGTTPPPPAFDFALTNGGNKTVTAGASVANAVTATLSSGTTTPVTFSTSGLPSDVTASFSAPTCNPTCASTLTLVSAAGAPASTSTVTVTGTAGALIKATTFQLVVKVVPPPPAFNFTLTNGGNKTVTAGGSITNAITATLSAGSSTPVTFSTSALPSGVTASFSAPTCNPTCASTLTLVSAAGAPASTSTVTVTGTAGALIKTTTFQLVVKATPPSPAFNFALTNSGNKTITQGQATTTLVTATHLTGSTTPVTFSTAGLPSGVTGTFFADSCSPTCTSTLTLTAAADAPASTSTVTVTGTAGALVKTSTFTLVINVIPPPPPAFNFTLTNSGNKSVVAGNAVTNAMTATLSLGAGAPATFSVSGLPSGVSGTFSAPICTPTCSTTLTLNASIAAAAGNSTVTVTATAGSIVKTSSFVLTVSAVSPPVTNLIANPSMETEGNPTTMPAGWVQDHWGTNTFVFTYLKNFGHTGTHSARVQITSHTEGDAKWDFVPVTVTPGASFKFTDWYQSNIDSQVVVYFSNASGAEEYIQIGTAPASAGWSQFTGTVQVPIGATTMTVFHLINQVGTLTIDDASLSPYVPQGFNRPIVTITFDDGWEQNITTALPTLNQKGFDATYFFATTFLENSPQTGALGVSGPATLQAIQAAGHEIGSHSVTHPDLTTITAAEAAFELQHAKDYLESIAGAGSIKHYAAPFGTYNDAVIAKAQEVGYKSYRTTDVGYNTKDNYDPYRLKVQNMLNTTTLAEYQSWIDQALADKSWLVIVYHKVDSTNIGPYDTPIDQFAPQMNIIQNSGISVLTMEQAYNETLSQF